MRAVEHVGHAHADAAPPPVTRVPALRSVELQPSNGQSPLIAHPPHAHFPGSATLASTLAHAHALALALALATSAVPM